MNLTKLLAGLLGAAASCSATASPPAANGVMEFPNVTVVAQPAPESGRAAPPPRAGMTAYKDPTTGKLTAPTAGQATALIVPPKAAAAAAAASRPALTRPPHGGVAVKLDERHERYAVARKDAAGMVAATCEPDSKLGEHDEK
ncbi:hypothetical protein SAMN05428959_103551 [Duganella sp. CF517]|uniref:post-PEP-CTERM-1 domain-containing protein n=1 Tax=Duganella sp. CF517 TaxID=1881038 RepID=UPI0008C25FBC|nr:hypothetical protein [Duganella sp. CF517]SEN87612.1 hypothetical protein SAMN05428959_103551 [Duganella sp. CF517]